jgi:protein-S-isoprenylcysteine O-methyltransferase Ste14
MARTIEAVILIVLPILFHYLFPVLVIVPAPYTYLGLILIFLALALATWAAMTFRKTGTSYQLHGEVSYLVTSGPFRFSRNPMYLAMVIWLVGLALLLGSLIAFLFPVLLFLPANFLIIPAEERSLKQMFEEQYSKYRQRVRRWL